MSLEPARKPPFDPDEHSSWARTENEHSGGLDLSSAHPLSAHRLLGGGRSLALVTAWGEVDWWCAPEPDSPPLLWSLLGSGGACSRWADARYVGLDANPAGPAVEGILRVGERRIRCRDGLADVDGAICLVRLVRSEEGAVDLVHQAAVGGFDRGWGVPAIGGFDLGDATVHVVGPAPGRAGDRWLETPVRAVAERWSGLALCLGSAPPSHLDAIVAALDEAVAMARAEQARARLPRHHPRRAADALAVLDICTYRPTGAVVAAATTSVPEAPGADRQFDYRYCWMRDAALAVSVASLLGRRASAERYLAFVRRVARRDRELVPSVVDVRGGDVPPERDVDGVPGWAGSRPVRVGNGARGQLQYDAWGLVAEAVSVHLQTGGSLDDDTWSLVRTMADRICSEPAQPSHGIWELRTPRNLVSADIGRWLVLDRAVWIARGWRPTARRAHWKRARAEIRDRVLGALEPGGGLPQAYGDSDRPDASALMAVVFGLIKGDDPRAAQLVDATLRDLGAGPYLYRYRPGGDDGFAGVEGTFLPMAWWAVAGLAVTGRVGEAQERLDQLCARLPRLLSEEIDPVDDRPLGNVPLVWSHMELARALYILDAMRLKARFGAAGLWAWRLARYGTLRWRSRDPG